MEKKRERLPKMMQRQEEGECYRRIRLKGARILKEAKRSHHQNGYNCYHHRNLHFQAVEMGYLSEFKRESIRIKERTYCLNCK